jgi:hypothetical protein
MAAVAQSDMGKSAEQTTKSASAKGSSTEEQIKKAEHDCAEAFVKRGAAAVDLCEADDITSTDPSGRVTDKIQDKKDLSSGDVKLESLELSDIKVQVYGNTAVATLTANVKGTIKGQDLSGTYRSTDTWVKRQGKWKMVATQATKVAQQ